MILKRFTQFFVITLITLLFLELGFQLAHLAFYSSQTTKLKDNQITNELRIMCVGESITGGIPFDAPDSYPRILENLLKAKYPHKKITVINRGLMGAPTSDMLEALPTWIKEDKPQIIITMLGNGDRFFTHETLSFNPPSWLVPYLLKSRVLRLSNLLLNYATRKVQPTSAPAWELTLEEGDYYRDLYKKAVEFKSKQQWEKAISAFEFFLSEVQKRRELKDTLANKNNSYALQIPQSLLDFYYGAYRDIMGIHIETKQMEKTIPYLKHALDLDPKSAYLHFTLARVYRNLKDDSQAREQEILGEKLLNSYSSKIAQNNYKQMAKLIHEAGITHVAMQYPMRPISPLKIILQDYPQITFIDNESSFRKVSSGQHYFEYFNDICGGNFGHGTQKGNLLIAQNIIDQFFSNLN